MPTFHSSQNVCVRDDMGHKYDPEDLCSGAPDPLGVSADRDDREFRNEMVDRVTTNAAGTDKRQGSMLVLPPV